MPLSRTCPTLTADPRFLGSHLHTAGLHLAASMPVPGLSPDTAPCHQAARETGTVVWRCGPAKDGEKEKKKEREREKRKEKTIAVLFRTL